MDKQEVIGKVFPKITAYSLAKNEVTLPDISTGKVALIGIGFVREAQDVLDFWSVPFEKRFEYEDNYIYYEVPMIKGIWKIFKGSINDGMRSGTSIQKHENIITYYGNYDYYTSYLLIDNLDTGYVFLLDRENIIRYRDIGFTSEKEIENMLRIAERLGK